MKIYGKQYKQIIYFDLTNDTHQYRKLLISGHNSFIRVSNKPIENYGIIIEDNVKIIVVDVENRRITRQVYDHPPITENTILFEGSTLFPVSSIYFKVHKLETIWICTLYYDKYFTDSLLRVPIKYLPKTEFVSDNLNFDLPEAYNYFILSYKNSKFYLNVLNKKDTGVTNAERNMEDKYIIHKRGSSLQKRII